MKRALVRIENVDVELGGKLVLRDVTWQLRPGEHWAVLGPNGSGKSTFLKLVRGELWPAPGCPGQRSYWLDSDAHAQQSSAVGIKERFPLVSPELQSRYLYQEWTPTVSSVVQSGVGGGDYVYQRLDAGQLARVEEVIRLMRVERLRSRRVQELSTGELRRVLVARALAARPRVLVCDEICDGLDASGRAELLSALDAVAREGTQLLITTHRRQEILPVMTHVLRMEEGRIAEQGRVEALERNGSSGKFLGGISGLVSRQDSRRPIKDKAPIQPAEETGPVLIQIRNADVYLDLNPRPVLQGIQMEIRAGQHWAVLGPNGSGKSTLLKLIAGDLHPAVGARVRRFEFTRRNTLWQLRARIGYVSPELQSNYRETITGAEVVASGFFSSVGLMRRPSAAQRRSVAQIIDRLGLGSLAGKNFLEMSYGEARRILLARALVKRPALLLLDEPFDGLDAGARAMMSETLARAGESGTTLVMVTHHDEDLPECITHVARLAAGRINYAGPRPARPAR